MSYSYRSGEPSKRARFKYWWWKVRDNLKEWILIFFYLVLFMLGVFALGAAFIYPFEKWTCDAKAEQMQLESHYSFWTECMIKVDGSWIPLSSYIVNSPTK